MIQTLVLWFTVLKSRRCKRLELRIKDRLHKRLFLLNQTAHIDQGEHKNKRACPQRGCSFLESLNATKDAALVEDFGVLGYNSPHQTNSTYELLLSFECHNQIWGTTSNPWNRERVPGGSSGGGSCRLLRVFSSWTREPTWGGSIRIPAAWCGIVGLKPTYGYWSMKGIMRAPRRCRALSNDPDLWPDMWKTFAYMWC